MNKNKIAIESIIYNGFKDVLEIYGSSPEDRKDELSDRMATRLREIVDEIDTRRCSMCCGAGSYSLGIPCETCGGTGWKLE